MFYFVVFAVKETNFVLNCNSSLIAIFQSRRRHCKYDWLESVWLWIWLAASGGAMGCQVVRSHRAATCGGGTLSRSQPNGELIQCRTSTQ